MGRMSPSPDVLRRLSGGELRSVVFFTGAGISTGAGLPTYRGPAGIYTTGAAPMMSAEDATPDRLPGLWSHFRDRISAVGVLQPAPAHLAIAAYAEAHPLIDVRVVTQNVDGLHPRVGRTGSVAELHGTLSMVRCLDDDQHRQPYDDADLDGEGVPRCRTCGAPGRPDVVLFGERLPYDQVRRARDWMYEAEVIVAVGTSAVVEPAAGMLRYELDNGTAVVWVNPEPAPWPRTTFVAGAADDVLPGLLGVSA
jgi:NAD-dependent deacetylase